jgi:hypothetical protein
MELLSQLDVQNPDHVSIITRENRVIISVRKDGSDVTLGFPLNEKVFDTTSRPPLQQSVTVLKTTESSTKQMTPAKRMAMAQRFNAKLNESSARQIKDMLQDKYLMKKFRSKHQAHLQIAQAFNVSVHTIRAIDKGNAWKHV